MGDSAAKKAAAANQAQLQKTTELTSNLVNTKAFQPSPLQGEMANFSSGMNQNYANAVKQQGTNYTDLMGGYGNLSAGLANRAPASFSYNPVSAEQVSWNNVDPFKNVSWNNVDPFKTVTATRPEELTGAFKTLGNAETGFQNFANTGGYSPVDIQELRARGTNPIKASFANAMMQVDRAKSLGGAGGSPNYIAAMTQMQRKLPGDLSDATTNVNAGLAEAIRSGKLSGLQGLTNVGSNVGNLSTEEANRILQANITNSEGTQRGNIANSQGNLQAGITNSEGTQRGQIANSQGNLQAGSTNAGNNLQAGMANSSGALQAAGMGESSYQNGINAQLAALGGAGNLYGTTPGMTSMFGNQALTGMGQQLSAENANNQTGFNFVDQNLNSLNNAKTNSGTPWWKKALAIAGTVAPYAAMAFSDRNMKTDISKPLDSDTISKGLKKLNLHTWKYKGDNTTHMGPMAQDFKKHLGIGDGHTIHLADVMGVMLATAKGA